VEWCADYIIGKKKQPENAECFYFLNSMTNGARCTGEINCRVAMARQLSTRSRIFTSRMVIKLRKKLVKCSIWSMTLRGAETWTVRKVYQKYVDSSEMRCC